jgi:hypothetical protein
LAFELDAHMPSLGDIIFGVVVIIVGYIALIADKKGMDEK